jgi:putative flavoprotein involved in K+ transport
MERGSQNRRVAALVVGAGQAGLAAARALQAAGVDCVVHERRARVGDSWRARFDSLTLFTSREMSALPGLPIPGDPRGWPTKDEMADYLEQYCGRMKLPVVTGNGIARLSRGSGGFIARTDDGHRIEAAAVVIATGSFQQPDVPRFAAALSESVQQLDAASYRKPAGVAGSRAIVVGDGATGRQIALELARDRRVTLALGSRRLFGPQTILGKELTGLARRIGLLTADKASLVGRLNRALDPTPGLHLRAAALRRSGVRLAPRCIGAGDDFLSFADGSRRRCDSVIWAAGYRDDTSWVGIDGAASVDGYIEARGIAPIPGLYYVGREWQNSRASGLICGVADDARTIAARVRQHLQPAASA